MSYTTTLSETATFTITHARHIASKVATDLKRMQRFYGVPNDASISAYQDELTLLLKGGYLGTVTYGFCRDGKFIEPTLRYTARDLAGSSTEDDDPGRVRPSAETASAAFYSYLTYSALWDRLSQAAKEEIEKQRPFRRNGAPEPAVDGYLCDDRTYSAGGRALSRASVRTIR